MAPARAEEIDTTHELLVRGDDFASCERQVLRFFAQTLLLRYERPRVVAARSLPATDPAFRERVDMGLAANRRELAQLLAELQVSGVSTLSEACELPTGYRSKILHIIAHFVDGFIGIDSHFYNLIEDSHGLTAEGWGRIAAEADKYWLLYLEAHAESVATASLIHRGVADAEVK